MSADIVTYTCDDCGIEIEGESWDPQESPRLYCPDCGQEMEFGVDWSS